jgi:hypothetical protein
MRRSSGMAVLLVALGMAGWSGGRMAAQSPNSEASGAAADADQPVTPLVSAASSAARREAAIAESNAVAEGNGAMAGDSHVRIVRLSEVRGTVSMDRKTGQGFEPTMQNMPIIEGAKLMTADGVAEVEFEDGSSMRVAPNSQIAFPQLLLRASGAKATTVRVERGMVYVSTEAAKGNEFTLKTGQTSMTVMPSTHLRLQLDDSKTAIAVISGNVTVESNDTTTLVGKKQTLTLDAASGGKTELAKNIAEAPFDEWDKKSMDYHKHYSGGSAFASSPYSYGVSDLNYYGSFVNAPGCGVMWQPYLVSSSWSPYANGLWAMYPGAGYSWVSPYPWGWLPYHSGSWMQCPGVGWGWQPGNNWQGLRNVAGFTATPGAGSLNAGQLVNRPYPVRPPLTARSQSLVVSNSAPLVVSKEKQPGQFVFEKNSAGMGVPRGSLESLNKISNDVNRHGSVNREVYSVPVGSGQTANGAARQGSQNGYPHDGHSNTAASSSASSSSPTSVHSSAGGGGGYGSHSAGGGGNGSGSGMGSGGGSMGGGGGHTGGTSGSGSGGGPHGPVTVPR